MTVTALFVIVLGLTVALQIVLIIQFNKFSKIMANTLSGVLNTLTGEATTLTAIQAAITAGIGLQAGQVAVNQTDIDALQTQANTNATTATSILSGLPAAPTTSTSTTTVTTS